MRKECLIHFRRPCKRFWRAGSQFHSNPHMLSDELFASKFLGVVPDGNFKLERTSFVNKRHVKLVSISDGFVRELDIVLFGSCEKKLGAALQPKALVSLPTVLLFDPNSVVHHTGKSTSI